MGGNRIVTFAPPPGCNKFNGGTVCCCALRGTVEGRRRSAMATRPPAQAATKHQAHESRRPAGQHQTTRTACGWL